MFLGLAGVDFCKLGLFASCLTGCQGGCHDRSWIPVHTIVFCHQKVSDVVVILPSRSWEISSSGNVEQSQQKKGSKSLHFVSAITFVKLLLSISTQLKAKTALPPLKFCILFW